MSVAVAEMHEESIGKMVIKQSFLTGKSLLGDRLQSNYYDGKIGFAVSLDKSIAYSEERLCLFNEFQNDLQIEFGLNQKQHNKIFNVAWQRNARKGWFAVAEEYALLAKVFD